MSNLLKDSLLAAIYSLHDKGWSQRRIARELGLNREKVGRYLRLPKTSHFDDRLSGSARKIRLPRKIEGLDF
jgi:predicted transcriptional regulator